MEYIIVIFFSYLSGSIPYGLLLSKIFVNTDVRKIGSGNIGATNVFRSGNRILALITLILDALKGYVPVLISINFYPEQVQIAALMVFLGHIFPVWLKFKGGKGVATYLGVLFAMALPSSFLFIFTWITVLLIFRYSSVSSMFGALTVLIVNIIKDNTIIAINENLLPTNDINFILFVFFILIIFTHRNNISNLKNKLETKIKI
jgi:acyl phosphate:glycerol-3-phosphate acyltransferase